MNPLAALGRLVRRPYRTLAARQALELVEGGALLVDVREPAEWRAGHARGARHVPLGQLAARLAELPADWTIVTVCRSGARSARAAALLAGDGRDAVNLAGGMPAWQRAGLPVTAAGKRPGRVV